MSYTSHMLRLIFFSICCAAHHFAENSLRLRMANKSNAFTVFDAFAAFDASVQLRERQRETLWLKMGSAASMLGSCCHRRKDCPQPSGIIFPEVSNVTFCGNLTGWLHHRAANVAKIRRKKKKPTSKRPAATPLCTTRCTKKPVFVINEPKIHTFDKLTYLQSLIWWV